MFFFGLVVECCSIVGAKTPLGLAFSLVAKLLIHRHRHQSISGISLSVCYRIVLEKGQDADSCTESEVLVKM
jgi:hypothetical protein